MPVFALSSRVRYARIGVGSKPNWMTVKPATWSPAMRECSSMGLVVRVSWAMVIVPLFVVVAMAKPIFTASSGVRSLFAMALIPEVPKSFNGICTR